MTLKHLNSYYIVRGGPNPVSLRVGGGNTSKIPIQREEF